MNYQVNNQVNLKRLLINQITVSVTNSQFHLNTKNLLYKNKQQTIFYFKQTKIKIE